MRIMRTRRTHVRDRVEARAGLWHETRRRLLSSPLDIALTLVSLYIAARVTMAFVDWALLRATFSGADGATCSTPGAGACWPFIAAKLGLFLNGRYPEAELWRVHLTYALALAGILPLTLAGMPGRRWFAVYLFAAFPFVATALLHGGVLGLAVVPTEMWGGLLVTLVVASSGMAASFPIGILLALGRRSELPVVRVVATGFIEIVRGVPLITVLFMSSVMLPLVLPPDVSFDKLLRALIGVALFSGAYMAEVVRGGLQAIPRGQYEAAEALGLSYWQKMGLVILPQALRIVVPGIINSFIALFKDTSLVLIIGLFDLLGIVQQSVQADAKWFSPQTAATGFFFAGFIFWAFSFAISRYAARLERQLAPPEGSTRAGRRG